MTLGAIIIMKNGKYRAFVYVVAWVGWLATQAMYFKGAINYSGRIKLTTKCCHHLYCCPARWMVVQSMCGGGTERELAVDIVPGQGIMSASVVLTTHERRERGRKSIMLHLEFMVSCCVSCGRNIN